jgi:hypothetical protein
VIVAVGAGQSFEVTWFARPYKNATFEGCRMVPLLVKRIQMGSMMRFAQRTHAGLSERRRSTSGEALRSGGNPAEIDSKCAPVSACAFMRIAGVAGVS